MRDRLVDNESNHSLQPYTSVMMTFYSQIHFKLNLTLQGGLSSMLGEPEGPIRTKKLLHIQQIFSWTFPSKTAQIHPIYITLVNLLKGEFISKCQ